MTSGRVSRGDRLSCWLDHSGATRGTRETDDEKWIWTVSDESDKIIMSFKKIETTLSDCYIIEPQVF